jgi:hypothetical protein
MVTGGHTRWLLLFYIVVFTGDGEMIDGHVFLR